MYLPSNQMLYDLYFTTATVKNWKHLFKPDKYKDLIASSLDYLAREGSCWVYAFVVMPNHFHVVWGMRHEGILEYTQQRMLKFIAQTIRYDLRDHHPEVLDRFRTDRKDRQYQFFKDRPLSVPIYTDKVAIQKIIYIHHNPVVGKWRLANTPEEYRWSSAAFYTDGVGHWPFLTNFWSMEGGYNL
jgi:REP element-mobilizing transposase RayT